MTDKDIEENVKKENEKKENNRRKIEQKGERFSNSVMYNILYT